MDKSGNKIEWTTSLVLPLIVSLVSGSIGGFITILAQQHFAARHSLNVRMEPGPRSAQIDQPRNYTVTVTNNGDLTEESVVIDTFLMSFVGPFEVPEMTMSASSSILLHQVGESVSGGSD